MNTRPTDLQIVGDNALLIKSNDASSYAYTIAFSDGHDTGIFSFDLLQQLGEPVT